jgi:hypothetical protein
MWSVIFEIILFIILFCTIKEDQYLYVLKYLINKEYNGPVIDNIIFNLQINKLVDIKNIIYISASVLQIDAFFYFGPFFSIANFCFEYS